MKKTLPSFSTLLFLKKRKVFPSPPPLGEWFSQGWEFFFQEGGSFFRREFVPRLSELSSPLSE